MRGGTDEHPTVLASVRDLTKGWSYTALVRARGVPRLHIDASETVVALQPATLAARTAASPPTVHRSSPGARRCSSETTRTSRSSSSPSAPPPAASTTGLRMACSSARQAEVLTSVSALRRGEGVEYLAGAKTAREFAPIVLAGFIPLGGFGGPS